MDLLKLEFTQTELNTIAQGLHELKFKTALPILQKIEMQVSKQEQEAKDKAKADQETKDTENDSENNV